MKRYKITVMLPHTQEVVVADLQEAHSEATKLVPKDDTGALMGTVTSIEFVGDVQTDDIFPEDPAA